ncbi:MAG TPA: PDZ domain-containing protein [Chthoniobacterales bacterium]|nr:PDZ domain-containing protein [Chthoniobacterales bacterium]
MRSFRAILIAIWVLQTAAGAAEPTPKEAPAPEEQKGSVVRVNSTNQAFDFSRPWSKAAPFSRRGLGVLIDGNNILVTAELVANSDYIELERADGGEKTTATVQVIDYEANLATLRSTNPKFLDGMQPLETTTDVKTGDELSVLQLESNGTPVSTKALVTTVEVGKYALEDSGYLMFRMSCPLQFRENSFTLPIVKGNKLAAFLMRYDSRSQTIDAIASPVIQHFLVESQHDPYRGFPRAGLGFSPTRDPQLRRYLKLRDADGGVYVNQVDQNGPAAKAGVKEGDVLVAIDDKQVDPDGNYLHPIYGKLSITHLTTTEVYSGQSVVMTVVRNGERQQLHVELFRRPIEDYAVEPYTIGKHPHYYILGGLVFQELTRQYLREWGANWLKDAPQRLVYYDRFQSDLLPAKRKIVFLSQILPTEDTVGYEQLSNLVVSKLNGRDILSLDDFAAAAKNPVAGFHKIEFEEDPHEIYLDAKQVEEGSDQLQKTYSIPALQHLSSRLESGG